MTLRSAVEAVAENVVAPLLVFGLLAGIGLTDVAALAGSATFSALVVALRALRTGRVPVLGALVGVQFLLAIGIAGIGGDARLMLAKEAVGTLVSTLLFAGSLLVGRPMLARIHRQFVPDPDVFDRRRADDARLRAEHTTMTAVWAVGLLLAAVTVIAAAYLPPLPVAIVASHVVSVPVYLGMIAWTVRRMRRRAPDPAAT